MRVPLHGRGGIVGWATVDDADASLVLDGKRWHLHPEGYAMRTVRVGPRRVGRMRAEKMHRMVLGLVPGDPEVDHISGDKLDNRRANLRLATRSEQMQNRRGGYGASSLRGVTPYPRDRSRWLAYGKADGRRKHIGIFDTEDEAGAAAAAWRAVHMPRSAEATAVSARPDGEGL